MRVFTLLSSVIRSYLAPLLTIKNFSIMKFTVEVEDFYLEEGDLTVELKRQIKNDVVAQIRDDIKKQVTGFMDDYIKTEIQSELKVTVKLLIDEFVRTGKVKGRYSSDTLKTIPEWIADNITDDRRALTESIAKAADIKLQELQNRYDLLFATQLISKIKEQGFLKDDAARMLLGDQQTNS